MNFVKCKIKLTVKYNRNLLVKMIYFLLKSKFIIINIDSFINYDKKEKEKEILNFRQIKLIVKYPEIKEK